MRSVVVCKDDAFCFVRVELTARQIVSYFCCIITIVLSNRSIFRSSASIVDCFLSSMLTFSVNSLCSSLIWCSRERSVLTRILSAHLPACQLRANIVGQRAQLILTSFMVTILFDMYQSTVFVISFLQPTSKCALLRCRCIGVQLLQQKDFG